MVVVPLPEIQGNARCNVALRWVPVVIRILGYTGWLLTVDLTLTLQEIALSSIVGHRKPKVTVYKEADLWLMDMDAPKRSEVSWTFMSHEGARKNFHSLKTSKHAEWHCICRSKRSTKYSSIQLLLCTTRLGKTVLFWLLPQFYLLKKKKRTRNSKKSTRNDTSICKEEKEVWDSAISFTITSHCSVESRAFQNGNLTAPTRASFLFPVIDWALRTISQTLPASKNSAWWESHSGLVSTNQRIFVTTFNELLTLRKVWKDVTGKHESKSRWNVIGLRNLMYAFLRLILKELWVHKQKHTNLWRWKQIHFQ